MGVINWMLERFSEASTWRGLIAFTATLGVAIDPVVADKIIITGISLIGLIEIIRKEKK